MLALIRTLGPVVAMIIGVVGGGAVIGGLGTLYNIYIDNPQVERLATARANDACTIRTMAAANEARIETEARVRAATDAALKAYQAAVDEKQALQEQIQDQLAQENADYEKQLEAENRSCPLSSGDLDFLRKQ